MKKLKNKKKLGKSKVVVNLEVTELRVTQSVRQSANYHSAECSFGLTAKTSPETLARDIEQANDLIEDQLRIKMDEQGELLNAMPRR